jgi:hypothetical protein
MLKNSLLNSISADPWMYRTSIPAKLSMGHSYWKLFGEILALLKRSARSLEAQRWLAEDLGIRLGSIGVRSWVDDEGHELIKLMKPAEDRSADLIREEELLNYCTQQEVTPIWLLIAERNTWPAGDNDHSCWRRSEGAWWESARKWKSVSWNNDTKR